MLENNQPVDDSERELTDADLDMVSGGDQKPIVKPKPKPTSTSGGGTIRIDGVDGESSHKDHKGEIEILSW